jgi:hypothetical protein
MKKILLVLILVFSITSLTFADGITIQTRGAKKGVNDDITSMTGLDDNGIPGGKVTAATDAAEGVSELATDAETVTGTATDKVTTPANITAKMAEPGEIGGTTPAAGNFTTIDIQGGQAKFPATSVPSADPNTLDDYEEGSYTVTVTGSTSGYYNLNGSRETLAYRKFGNLVFVQGEVAILNADGSPLGNLQFSLPFAVASLSEFSENAIGSAILWGHGGTITNGVYPKAASGESFFHLVNVDDSGAFDLIDNTHVDTLWDFAVGFWYITSE